MTNLKLKPTQRLLWRCVTEPKLPKGVVLPLRGDRRLSARARVGIYARMYFDRIVDSLAEDFPSLWELLDEDEFHSLVRAYLAKYPSPHWTLRNAGKDLPRFLQRHSLLKKWPFVMDLARLEWEMIEVFDAADGTPLSEAKLKSLPPESWGQMHLRLILAHRLLQSRWPLYEIREGILEHGSWSGRPQSSFLQVWRQERNVLYRSVDRLEFELLQSLQRGASLASLCQQIVDQVGEAAAPRKTIEYLQSWLQDQILTC